MTIPSTIESLSTTAASNNPTGSAQRTEADDGLRAAYAFIKQLCSQGSDQTSGSTVTPPSTGSQFDVTGTTTITTLASTNSWDGRRVLLQFDGILTLTHSSNLYLPGAANITTAAGDVAEFLQRGSGSWQCINYQRKDGSTPWTVAGSFTTLSATGNVTLGDAGGDTVTINGNVTSNAPTSGNNFQLSQVAGGFGLAQQNALSGSTAQWLVQNGSNTSASDSRLYVSVGGSSGGDSYILFDVSGVGAWYVGLDNSNSDALIFGRGSLGSADKMSLTTGGYLTLAGGASTAGNTQTFSATPTFDASASNYFEMAAMTSNVTSVTISNATAGQTITIRFVQDGTGGRTVASPSGAKISGSVGSAASAASMLTLTYTSASRWEGAWLQLPA